MPTYVSLSQVCDADCWVMSIDPRYPGSVHDSFAWRYSWLRSNFEQGRLIDDGRFLLGKHTTFVGSVHDGSAPLISYNITHTVPNMDNWHVLWPYLWHVSLETLRRSCQLQGGKVANSSFTCLVVNNFKGILQRNFGAYFLVYTCSKQQYHIGHIQILLKKTQRGI